MGVVYEAEDIKLCRHVALKVLPESLANDSGALRLFQREARAASSLNHPNICTIYEIEEHDGQPILVMELMQGSTLKDRVERGPLPLHDLLEVSIALCEGLEAAHEQGIVHRDIKPANIFVTLQGTTKILDFGLAKLLPHVGADNKLSDTSQDESLLSLTVPGMIRGTAPYMSPEQARGDELDRRTDIFSLGVVMYEMATGTRPFQQANAVLTIDAILNAKPKSILKINPAVPKELEAIVEKALEKSREARYQTAAEMLLNLKNLRREIAAMETAELERPNLALPTVETGGAVAAKGAAVADIEANAKRRATSAWKVTEAAVVTLALIVLIAIVKNPGIVGRGTPTINSIAVLPFTDANANADTEYLSEGITEGVINDLTQIPTLKVMARSTVFHYKGRDVDPRKVGDELQVAAVMTGRLLQRGDSITVQVELVQVADGVRLWGERYTRDMTNLSAMQQEIARDIFEKLRLRLSPTQMRRLAADSVVDQEAYRLYLKGRYLWNQRTAESLKESIKYFNLAVEKDPNYAMAWVGLADAFNIVPGYTGWSQLESYDRAKQAAARAIQLDEGSAEAHTAMATALSNLSDYQHAESEFIRALELNPSYTNGHYFYAISWLMPMGRLQEASAELKKALELDPFSLIINTNLGRNYFFERRYEKAREQFQRTAEIDPDFGPLALRRFDLEEVQGNYQAAMACLKNLSQRFPDVPDMDPERLERLRRAYASRGEKGYWETKLGFYLEDQKLHHVSSANLAISFARIGDLDTAFRWLRQSVDEHEQLSRWINVDPRFDVLRSDPRFAELLRATGLGLSDSKSKSATNTGFRSYRAQKGN